jgi:membrane fusion protein
MSERLYRQEAIDAKRHSFLGSISIVQPVRLWVFTTFGIFAGLVIVLFLVFGEYTRRTTVKGSLVPNLGLVTLVAPTQGVVSTIFAQEGNRIRNKQPLISIQSPRLSQAGADVAAQVLTEIDNRKLALQEINSAKLQQTDAQIAGIAMQLVIAQSERVQLQAEIQTKREQLGLSQESLQRYESLAGSQYVSQIQLEQQKSSVLSNKAALQAFQRQASERLRVISQMQQTLNELRAQRRTIQAGQSNEMASLAQERSVQDGATGYTVRAPLHGLVTSRLIEAGQMVQAGQPLISVLPEASKLEAHLLVPSTAMGFIESGDAVLLRYQAYPYQKFGHYRGKVKSLTQNVVSTDNQSGQSFYRAIVVLDKQSVLAYGKQEPLRPGLAVEADILGDTRKLYEWLFEPIYALSGRL